MPYSFEANQPRSALMYVLQAPTFQTLNYTDKNFHAALYGDEIETLKENIQQKNKV